MKLRFDIANQFSLRPDGHGAAACALSPGNRHERGNWLAPTHD